MEQIDRTRLAIELVQLSQIRRNPANARVHSSKQIANLASSIGKFGFLVPVLMDDQDLLLCGHARLEAAEQAGMALVPAIRVQHLSKADKHAFAIADNRLAESASWDEALLRKELQFLSDMNIDFDFATIGFETAEVDLLLDASPPGVKEDKVPARSDGPAVSRAGDLWALGSHRLLCGDARARQSYETLLSTDRARMVFADPPYNVRIDGHAGGLGSVKHREFAMASGEMTDGEFIDFLSRALRHMGEFTADGSLHFICMDWRHTKAILDAAVGIYPELKNICVWNKTNAGMGSLYRSKHEFVFVFKNGTAPHSNNIELGKHGRSRANVWDYPGINSFGSDRDHLLALHPTVKPVALVADAIKDCSKHGEFVLDPFAGSGTTLIAAEKTRRRAMAIEIDPFYVDASVRRWQLYTGKEAACAATGMTFSQRETALAEGSRPA